MKVRGAPAIGAAAAYGVALEAKRIESECKNPAMFSLQMQQTLDMLSQTRPTAVNLFWAIREMDNVLRHGAHLPVSSQVRQLADRAIAIAQADEAMNRRMGHYGTTLFANRRPVQVLTHCNTGSLATVGYGTAIGVIHALHDIGQLKHVWVDETRPYLQGARLTTFELKSLGVPHTLITDSMAAYFMQQGHVDAVIVGADRIAANGDTANKIGTYSLAVLAAYHHVPFYVAAPSTTFDRTIQTGDEIIIEERSGDEVTHWQGKPFVPEGTKAAHPAFDVTPCALITAIITETGVIERPSREKISTHMRNR